jgi:hypothetical protein
MGNGVSVTLATLVGIAEGMGSLGRKTIGVSVGVDGLVVGIVAATQAITLKIPAPSVITHTQRKTRINSELPFSQNSS